MRAYVLLKVKPAKSADLMSSLKRVDGVVEASLIHGPYDCIAHIDAPDIHKVNDTVLNIREISGIQESMTCLVVQSWRRH